MAVVGRGFEVALHFNDILADDFAIAQADGKFVFCPGESLIDGFLEPFGRRREIQLGGICGRRVNL
jgi:hypothetical protein